MLTRREPGTRFETTTAQLSLRLSHYIRPCSSLSPARHKSIAGRRELHRRRKIMYISLSFSTHIQRAVFFSLARQTPEYRGPQRTSPPSVRDFSVFYTITSHTRVYEIKAKNGYDPSAGSPTETLLRLLLPLKDQVRTFFSPDVNRNLASPERPAMNPDGPVQSPH